jgi:hypothetical protein
LLNLTVACSTDCHWHFDGHQENVYANHIHAFSSLSPYCMLLQAFVMYLREVYIAINKILCLHIVLKLTFSLAINRQSIVIKKQLTIAVPKVTELALKWHHECYQFPTLKYPVQFYSL